MKASLGRYWRDLSGKSVRRLEDSSDSIRRKHSVEARDLGLNGGTSKDFEDLSRKHEKTWGIHNNNTARAFKRRYYARALTGTGVVAGTAVGASLLPPSTDDNKSEQYCFDRKV